MRIVELEKETKGVRAAALADMRYDTNQSQTVCLGEGAWGVGVVVLACWCVGIRVCGCGCGSGCDFEKKTQGYACIARIALRELHCANCSWIRAIVPISLKRLVCGAGGGWLCVCLCFCGMRVCTCVCVQMRVYLCVWVCAQCNDNNHSQAEKIRVNMHGERVKCCMRCGAVRCRVLLCVPRG